MCENENWKAKASLSMNLAPPVVMPHLDIKFINFSFFKSSSILNMKADPTLAFLTDIK